eukprot:304929-Chlamydomonas_euryale.AAC.1
MGQKEGEEIRWTHGCSYIRTDVRTYRKADYPGSYAIMEQHIVRTSSATGAIKQQPVQQMLSNRRHQVSWSLHPSSSCTTASAAAVWSSSTSNARNAASASSSPPSLLASPPRPPPGPGPPPPTLPMEPPP